MGNERGEKLDPWEHFVHMQPASSIPQDRSTDKEQRLKSDSIGRHRIDTKVVLATRSVQWRHIFGACSVIPVVCATVCHGHRLA